MWKLLAREVGTHPYCYFVYFNLALIWVLLILIIVIGGSYLGNFSGYIMCL